MTAQTEDRQATWMAYTANAAIVPRNKLGNIEGEGPRQNRFVRENEISEPGRTILATEFNRNWKAISLNEGAGFVSKAHRPLNPFWSIEGGYNEYGNQLALTDPFYYYPSQSGDKNYGLKSFAEIEEGTLGGADVSFDLNFVGRHHPGDDRLGGSANFLFVDGHVEKKTVLQTMKDREWGKAYHAINGPNKVNIPLGYEKDPG